MHVVLLQHSHVRMVHSMPWSDFFYLKFYNLLSLLVLHPWDGYTDVNVTKWLKLVEIVGGFSSHA